jgi:hypothetical protein
VQALIDAQNAERDLWWRQLQAERASVEKEREAWAEERKLLLNAAVSKGQSEFLARQQASKPARPAPIHDLPVEAREARPRVMGL